MEKTIPHPYHHKTFIGYVVNSPFDENSQENIANLQKKFMKRFGDSVFIPSPETLHTTLMDWLAPLVDYGQDKDKLFKEIYEEYDRTLLEALEGIAPIQVQVDTIGVSPEAIFIRGHDNGGYQQIRDKFLGRVTLLPNTKRPPQIIHSTIGRFAAEISLQDVQNFAATQEINFTQTIDAFRLLRTTDTVMAGWELLKTYQLEGLE